jgi:hypothetical protein
VEVEGGGLGKLPGVEGKLPWGLAGAEVQWCSRSMAEQGLYTAEQSGDDARVLGSSHGVGDKEAGGPRVHLKEGTGDLGGRARGKAGEDCGWVVARLVEPGGRRGRQVGSGRQRERAARVAGLRKAGRKGSWAAGKGAGPRGERGAGRAGLKARFAFLFLFLFFFWFF